MSNVSTQIITMYSKHSQYFDPDTSYITSLLSISVLIGSMVGSMSVSVLLTKLSKKTVVISASFVACALNIAQVFPVSWIYLFIMRILFGIPSSIITTIGPSWLAELCEDSKRGIITTLYQVFVTFGIVISSLILLAIGSDDKIWYISFIPPSIFTFCVGICFCFFDNQPAQEQESNNTWENFFQLKYKKVIINAFLFGVAQQGTGVNAVVIYATQIFARTFSDDPNDYYSAIYGSMLISIVNFLATCLAIPLIQKINRRTLWFGGFIVCMIAHVMLIIQYTAIKNDILLIVSSIIFLVGFEIGPGPVFYVLCGETFPKSIKDKANTIAFTMNWTFNIFTVLIFPFLTEWVAYVLYLALTLIPVFIIWFTIPETKNKTLKQIEVEMIYGELQQEDIMSEYN
ncbi:Hexose_transporter [Hexamita inflata]|uniref:Hexose_transporter n=1 Tax=Hexamita inflata TaxID=28002 RepID=A0ABP1GF10_9EUKA